MIEKVKLAYELNSFEPYISAAIMDAHYNAHYTTYINNTNSLLEDDNNSTLPEIVINSYKSGNTKLFNNSAQSWNHEFLWNCLAVGVEVSEDTDFYKAVLEQYGSFSDFKKSIKECAATHFASGWLWVVTDKDGKFKIYTSSNAETPLVKDENAILTIDLWEHAYYLDYKYKRAGYVETILDNVINWKFCESRYK